MKPNWSPPAVVRKKRKHFDFSEDDTIFLRENYLLMSKADIAKKLKRTKKSVECKMTRLRLVLPSEVSKRRMQEGQRQMITTKIEAYQQKRARRFKFRNGYSIYSITYFANEKRISKISMVNKKTDVDAILLDICDVFQVSLDRILSSSRKKEYVRCRQIFIHVVCSSLPSVSLGKIAEVLGYRDHSSIIHHRENVRDFLAVEDKDFMSDWYKYTNNSKVFKRPLSPQS